MLKHATNHTQNHYKQYCTNSVNLPEIISKRKNGTEKFQNENQNLNFKLSEFWSWNQSNLIENRTRGILAEFIVKKALEIDSENRIEWDNFDLITKKSKKLEIKSAAYIQSWEQKKYSEIKFGIAPTVGTKDNPNYDGIKRRWTDFYVFCLLKNKDQKTLNPLDLSQWTFFVLETKILNEQKPEQKTIGINSLLELKPIECKFYELKKIIDK
ncbi:hypothetical protein GCM10007028_28230 [Algibacter mikhailovii]|uniref:Uncharacterized protein n=1 Tax=Algibacter mikhailovii TaxID=425498 RepID=A0A918R7R3_9FLAO|nr:hypothetical protein GCM10007028_28230 [Algibacter mikhailovii]